MQFYHSILALLAVAYLNEAVSAGGDYTDSDSVAVCADINREMEERLKVESFSRFTTPTKENTFGDLARDFRTHGSSSGYAIKKHLFALNQKDCTRENFEHAKASVECTKIDWRDLSGCMGGVSRVCTPLQNLVAERVFRRADRCCTQYMKEFKEAAKDMDASILEFTEALGSSFKGKCYRKEDVMGTMWLPSEGMYKDCMEDNIGLVRDPINAQSPHEEDKAKLSSEAVEKCKTFVAKFDDLISRVRWEFPVYNSMGFDYSLYGVWASYQACKVLVVQPMDVIVYSVSVPE